MICIAEIEELAKINRKTNKKINSKNVAQRNKWGTYNLLQNIEIIFEKDFGQQVSEKLFEY